MNIGENMKKKNNNQSKNTGKSFRRQLWSAAGAVGSVLEDCPTEHNKYTAIGTVMIFIALLASVSFAFFLSATFGVPFLFALPFGFVWGGLIFCLDRVLLTSFRKGEKSRISIIQRFLLTAAIAIIIGEPLLLQFFRSEINLELVQKSQTVLQEAREKAEQRYKSEKDSLENNNREINTRLDNLKAERDAKEQTVISETEGKSITGKAGFGIAAKQKEIAFKEADEKYLDYKTEAAETLKKNAERLVAIGKAVEDETKLVGTANTEANGILARHKALISIVRNDLGAALIYIPLFIALLFLETLPLSVKVFGKTGVYDTALETAEAKQINELTDRIGFEKDYSANFFAMKKAFNKRLLEIVRDGKIKDLSDQKEIETVKILQAEILLEIEKDSFQRQTKSFDFAEFGDEIIVEIVGRDEFEFVCQLPKNARQKLTLESLSGDIRRISEKIGKDLKLAKAFSSLKHEITANLPLLPQLEDDRRMFLLFKPLGEN